MKIKFSFLIMILLAVNVSANADHFLLEAISDWSAGAVSDFQLLKFIDVWSTGIMQEFDSMSNCDAIRNSVIDKLYKGKCSEALILYNQSYDPQCKQKAQSLMNQLRPHKDDILSAFDYYEDQFLDLNWEFPESRKNCSS